MLLPVHDLAYLSRSKYRVELLKCLGPGEKSRAEIESEPGISDYEIQNVLEDLRRRGLIRNEEGTVHLTPSGEFARMWLVPLIELVGDNGSEKTQVGTATQEIGEIFE